MFPPAASCAAEGPRDTGPVLLAHADGFNWDEALLVLAPIAIIAGVLLYANNKLQRGLGDQPPDEPDDGDGHDHDGTSAPDGPGDAAAPRSDPTTSA